MIFLASVPALTEPLTYLARAGMTIAEVRQQLASPQKGCDSTDLAAFDNRFAGKEKFTEDTKIACAKAANQPAPAASTATNPPSRDEVAKLWKAEQQIRRDVKKMDKDLTGPDGQLTLQTGQLNRQSRALEKLSNPDVNGNAAVVKTLKELGEKEGTAHSRDSTRITILVGVLVLLALLLVVLSVKKRRRDNEAAASMRQAIASTGEANRKAVVPEVVAAVDAAIQKRLRESLFAEIRPEMRDAAEEGAHLALQGPVLLPGDLGDDPSPTQIEKCMAQNNLTTLRVRTTLMRPPDKDLVFEYVAFRLANPKGGPGPIVGRLPDEPATNYFKLQNRRREVRRAFDEFDIEPIQEPQPSNTTQVV